jgi:uncharacterized protein YpmB
MIYFFTMSSTTPIASLIRRDLWTIIILVMIIATSMLGIYFYDQSHPVIAHWAEQFYRLVMR